MVYEHDEEENIEVQEVFVMPIYGIVFAIIILILIWMGIIYFG